MKRQDEEPSDEELREAAALAAALEKDARPVAGDAGPPIDALETAALLRHSRAPIAVPAAHEPIAAGHAAAALDARHARKRRRARLWIATSLVAPAVAAAFLLVRMTAERNAPLPALAAPAPSPALLAAQAQATRGGGGARAAFARLDLEMRAYRRQYHDGLRRRRGGEP